MSARGHLQLSCLHPGASGDVTDVRWDMFSCCSSPPSADISLESTVVHLRDVIRPDRTTLGGYIRDGSLVIVRSKSVA